VVRQIRRTLHVVPETDSDSEPSERLAIVAKLRAGSRDQAKEILAAGPPYDLDDAAFRRHTIFLGEDTVVFVFEGPGVRALLSKLIDDPASSASFSSWAPLLAGTPTLAHEEFHWEADRP
jgi:hypothetical protein